MVLLVDFRPRTVVAFHYDGKNFEEINKHFDNCSSNGKEISIYSKHDGDLTVKPNEYIVCFGDTVMVFSNEDFYTLFEDHYKKYHDIGFMYEPEDMKYLQKTPEQIKEEQEMYEEYMNSLAQRSAPPAP